MRNNYQQSEDSVKISRSKSRNQVSAASKLKEKVSIISCRKVDGMTDSTWITSQSITTRTSRTLNVLITNSDLKNKFRIPNRRVEPSRAKRLYEASLEKSYNLLTQTRCPTSQIPVETSRSWRKLLWMLFRNWKPSGTRSKFPNVTWRQWPRF